MDYNNEITVGDWMVTILLCCIPVVNIIMLLVWAFGGGTNKSKSNWAKAQLIWTVIFSIIGFVSAAAITALIANIANNFY